MDKTMNRTIAREFAVRLIFEMSFYFRSAAEITDAALLNEEYFQTLEREDELYSSRPDDVQTDYIKRVLFGVEEHAAELDSYIEKYSVGWKFYRISKMAIAIMRTAMFEILYMPEIPNSVSVNEAVEIAKKYETEETVTFINGILGKFIRTEV